MIMKTKISPSMMCADITKIKSTLETFEACGIDYLHIDIMDGHFVPHFMLSTDYCRHMKRLTSIPLDIHLMIEKPEEKLGWFEFGEGDIVSVHPESTAHFHKAIIEIRKRGAKAYAALNPATPISVLEEVLNELDGIMIMAVNPGFAGQKMVSNALDKIRRLRNYLDEKGYDNIEIEVDGNTTFENSVKMKAAGADMLVVGTSSIFNPELTLADGIAKFRAGLNE